MPPVRGGQLGAFGQTGKDDRGVRSFGGGHGTQEFRLVALVAVLNTVFGWSDALADGRVLAGLQALPEAQWVLVHDAARPCLHQDDLSRLLSLCETSRVGGILAAPVRDTMKRAEPGKTAIAHTVDRNDLWHALTPQFFPRELLVDCLTRALNEGATITDEASALEYCGFHPQLVAGRADNIKVTRPEDLALAEFYLTRSRHQEKA